jgi:molybdopterin-guanine dinucleotide biosynthesis protein A
MTTENGSTGGLQPPRPDARPPVTGLILAGGRGLRMGGADKGLLACEGRPLVARVAERLAPQVGRLLIVANRHVDDYRHWGAVVSDVIPGFEGPLAGLHAGLTAMVTEWALVVPVDAPSLPMTLLTSLWPSVLPASGGPRPVCAHDGQRPQPLFGLYHVSHASSMAESLARQQRTLMRWHDSAGTLWVRMEAADAFSNLNTPDELAGFSPGKTESRP